MSKSETPLVTVVTVTYNSSAYIRDAIESILSSSYTNFELIIGDDASTDNTWSIIQEYKDPRIVAYRNEQNLKEYPNRNKAISLAKGEYLIFIDGDDMIYPHGLEYIITMMRIYPTCGMLLMYPYLDWVFFPVIISPRDFYLSNFFSKGFNDIAFANTLFNTKILKENDLLPLKYKAGDTYIRLKIAAQYQTLIVQDQLTWWRETPGQASKLISKEPLSILHNYLLHSEIISELHNPLSDAEKMAALSNELFKVKLVLLSYIRRFALKKLVFLINAILNNNLFGKVVLSVKTYANPFKQYSSINPLRMNTSRLSHR
jgi:glycosyltransferase involved in cell wall biosynthesis